MQKFLLILIMILIVQPVMAKGVKVQALSDFSTARPSKTWDLRVVDGFVMDNGVVVHANTIVEGKIIDVVSPKRLKRNASFKFIPQTFYDPIDGSTKTVKCDFEGKYNPRSEIDARTLAKKGAMTAGNMLIGSFVAPAVGLVEGAVKNENGNRAKSAAISAYENTPLSYANKGKDLEFKKGQFFIMNFKLQSELGETNEPNYAYEMVN